MLQNSKRSTLCSWHNSLKRWALVCETSSNKQVKRCLNQFLQQKKYAECKNKQHIVFAPTIPTMTKIDYEKHGIKIVKDYKSLVNTIKEYE